MNLNLNISDNANYYFSLEGSTGYLNFKHFTSSNPTGEIFLLVPKECAVNINLIENPNNLMEDEYIRSMYKASKKEFEESKEAIKKEYENSRPQKKEYIQELINKIQENFAIFESKLNNTIKLLMEIEND